MPHALHTDPLHGFIEAPLPDDLRHEIETTLDGFGFRFGPALIRKHPAGCDAIVDASWFENPSASSQQTKSSARQMHRLLMYFHRPDATLPQFEIIPRIGLITRVLSASAGILGLPMLDLPDEPEFMRRYMIVTANPESVRTLLDRPAIDALIEARDLRIKSTDVGIIAMRAIKHSRSRRKTDDAAPRDDFERMIIDATLACMAFTDDPEAVRRAADAVPGSFTEEAVQTLMRTGGMIGAEMRKRLVPQSAVDALRDQPPPRSKIDPSIRRCAWGVTRFPMLITGAFALWFPAIGVGLLLSTATVPNAIAIGTILLVVGVGATIAFLLLLRHRLIRQHIVRRGIVVPASIKTIERTDTIINDERIHRVKFRPEGPRQSSEEMLIIRIGASYLDRARRIRREKAITWILQDPAKPRRALWPEGWVLEVE